MSRHYCDCLCEGRKVRVILGYDRPLNEIFMNVERLTRERASTMNYLYVSIADPNGNGELDYYADKLNALGIAAPNSLFLAVWEDALNRHGNYVVEHFADNTQRVIYDERKQAAGRQP